MDTMVISTGFHYTNLPESCVRPESERPKLSEVEVCEDVPVIDIGCGDGASIVRQIGNACRTYGFFQVVSHGVSKEGLEKMQEVAKDFFRLPVEEKMKLYSDDKSTTMRLSTSFNVRKEKVHNWRDYLRLHCYPLEQYVPEWPSNPSSFKDIVRKYCQEVGELGFRLEGLIAESLGLERNDIRKVLGEQEQHMVIHYYPACPEPEPEPTYGLPVHADSNAITILLQDPHVAGLRVLKEGRWLAIKPHPDAFVINIGDRLQVKLLLASQVRTQSVECRKFEIKLISASGLDDVRKLGEMKVYAVVSIAGDKRTERKTPVDYINGTNPAWNFTMTYTIGEKAVQEEGVMLVIKLFCKRTLPDRYVGEVRASIKQLYEQAMANGGGPTSYTVQRGGAESAGELKLSCSFREAEIVGEAEVVGEAEMVRKKNSWKKLLKRGAFIILHVAVTAAGEALGLDIPLSFD